MKFLLLVLFLTIKVNAQESHQTEQRYRQQQKQNRIEELKHICKKEIENKNKGKTDKSDVKKCVLEKINKQ